jgi:DNA-binding transcriptional ArsR family regulator
MERAYLADGPAEDRTVLKVVQIIRDEEAAKLISDPMRRAILNLLRQEPMTEASLAQALGLTDATVNYHLGLLKKIGFLNVVKRDVERHGIVQKFYAPTAYLYLPDVDALPKEVSRYYYPINIERARGVLSALKATGAGLAGREVDALGEDLARSLVKVSRRYAEREVKQGEGEPMVNTIYSEALSDLGLGEKPSTRG